MASESTTLNEFGKELTLFVKTVAGLAHFRLEENGIHGFLGPLSALAAEFEKEVNFTGLVGFISDLDAASQSALAVLQQELTHISERYAEQTKSFDWHARQPIGLALKDADHVEAAGERAAEDCVVVIESVKVFLDNAPPWLRRILDVLLELLKLSRGAI